jgi:hypothetical protein
VMRSAPFIRGIAFHPCWSAYPIEKAGFCFPTIRD